MASETSSPSIPTSPERNSDDYLQIVYVLHSLTKDTNFRVKPLTSEQIIQGNRLATLTLQSSQGQDLSTWHRPVAFEMNTPSQGVSGYYRYEEISPTEIKIGVCFPLSWLADKQRH